MTRARNLANLGNKNAITADIGLFNIGIGSTQPHDYKLEVVGGDAYIGGGVTITGNLSVGGTVTYEDVTNVDAVGIITANKGVNIVGGGLTCVGIATFFGDLQTQGDVSVVDTIYHSGDTNTKIRFPAADTFTVETGGSERLRIDSNGNIGINATPAGSGTLFDTVDHFLVIGDSDTGIAQDGDGQLELWSNNTEVANFGSVDGYTSTLPITTTNASVTIGDSIIHSGDTNTKIRFPSADTFTVETGGSERLRINSSGNVGFATDMTGGGGAYGRLGVVIPSQAAGAALQVMNSAVGSGDGSLSNIVLRSVNNSGGEWAGAEYRAHYHVFSYQGTEKLRINSSGLVGIGTDNPQNLLHIAGASSNNYIHLTNGTTGSASGDGSRIGIAAADSGLRIQNQENSWIRFDTNGSEKFRIASDGDVTITSADAGATGPTLKLTHNSASPADNDIIGVISMDGDDDAGNATEFSSIYTKVTDVSNSSETGHLAFKTRALSSYNEIFRLAGRSSASAPSYTTDDINGIILDVYNTGNPYPRYMNFIAKSGGDTDTNISFWTEAVGGSPTEKLRITEGGNLLVGATSVEDWDGSRDHRLQVRGTSSNNSGISILATQNDDNPCEIVLGKSRGTGNTIVGSADDVGQIRFSANDGNGFHSTAYIRATMDGTPGSDNLPSKLRFGTALDNTVTVSDRLVINNRGSIENQTMSQSNTDAWTTTGLQSFMRTSPRSIQFTLNKTWSIAADGMKSGIIFKLDGSTGDNVTITVEGAFNWTSSATQGGTYKAKWTMSQQYNGVSWRLIEQSNSHPYNCGITAVQAGVDAGTVHVGWFSGSTSGSAGFQIYYPVITIEGEGYDSVSYKVEDKNDTLTKKYGWRRNNNSSHRFETGGTERLMVDNGGLTVTNCQDGMIELRTSAATGRCWMQLSESDGTQKGYFGFGSSSNDTLYIVQNEAADMTFYSNSGVRMVIDSSGNIGAPSGNNIYNASDERLKENIVDLTNGLDKINKLKPVSFTWKDGWSESLEGVTQYGFGAQTTQEVDELLVEPFSEVDIDLNGETIENPLRVNEKHIIPLLVKAIQEQQEQIETLKTKVAALESK